MEASGGTVVGARLRASGQLLLRGPRGVRSWNAGFLGALCSPRSFTEPLPPPPPAPSRSPAQQQLDEHASGPGPAPFPGSRRRWMEAETQGQGRGARGRGPLCARGAAPPPPVAPSPALGRALGRMTFPAVGNCFSGPPKTPTSGLLLKTAANEWRVSPLGWRLSRVSGFRSVPLHRPPLRRRVLLSFSAHCDPRAGRFLGSR